MKTRVASITVILSLLVPSVATAQVDEDRLTQARARFEAGETAFGEERYDEALDAFQEAYELMEGHPNQGMIHFNVARAQDELGQRREAVRSYRAFLEEAPPDAPNRAVAIERITLLDADDRGAPAEAAESTSPDEPAPGPVQTRTEGHWANWVIAGALVAVAAPAIAVPLWTVATEGECLESDANGCVERVSFGAIDGVGLGLGAAALVGAILFAAGQPIQAEVQVSDEGAYVGVRGVF
ncbi:MAG TPA: tetratricopeptide repeat protein [Sandaracinaceae bacterium LLY-WYZ-13_1]|nr:tetratricopeptide repeat protein [Sandaracinaceae bacterium LLY-WYZ-13_1]